MIFGLMIFGIPAMVIAEKKGFKGARWLLAFGLIGLIIVCVLPSAKKRGIDYGQARKRAAVANSIGAWLCGANALVLFISLIALVFIRQNRLGPN
jgi:hypothetical protein